MKWIPIFYLYMMQILLCKAEDTAIQYQRYIPGQSTASSKTKERIKITYTRVILKKNKILDITPYQKIVVSKLLLCYDKCFESDGQCLSLNIKDLGLHGFECQLLNTDSFLRPNSLISQTGTQHVIIKDLCSIPTPCENGTRCVPNYTNRTRQCIFHPTSCKYWEDYEPGMQSGYREVYRNSDPSAIKITVYCDVSNGGGWLMITNVTITANNLVGNVNLGGSINEMTQEIMQSGYWTLDGRHLTYFNRDMFKITQIRYYCSKPIVGRVVHVISNATSICGQNFVGIVIGSQDRSEACIGNALTRLEDDTSLVLSNPSNTKLFVGNAVNKNRYYWVPFWVPGLHHFSFGGNRYHCDDNMHVNDFVGQWEIYIR
ncbi:uncharacterized protein [Clytia hemisphaerica]|uniref:Fibrinogen C-terminal domain-containing protein n=1 Tax=Clytia hemisphaerica TaxID=252671 RepID=A0A7M5WYH7_9CNID